VSGSRTIFNQSTIIMSKRKLLQQREQRLRQLLTQTESAETDLPTVAVTSGSAAAAAAAAVIAPHANIPFAGPPHKRLHYVSSEDSDETSSPSRTPPASDCKGAGTEVSVSEPATVAETWLLDLPRCSWCLGSKNQELRQAYIKYHDTEWGRPCSDDRMLFEKLCLESMQAGLSWTTILRKRAAFLEAFDSFDIDTVAQYDAQKIQELLGNAGIIRHRGKIEAVIKNAQVVQQIQREYGSFHAYLVSMLPNGQCIQTHHESMQRVPSQTTVSQTIALQLKKRGCKFVGTTIMYAFMQAVGLTNDHVTTCFLHPSQKKKH
jgi:DNA-3-methyladenine glycosylase I